MILSLMLMNKILIHLAKVYSIIFEIETMYIYHIFFCHEKCYDLIMISCTFLEYTRKVVFLGWSKMIKTMWMFVICVEDTVKPIIITLLLFSHISR